jgi:hypothetical protein
MVFTSDELDLGTRFSFCPFLKCRLPHWTSVSREEELLLDLEENSSRLFTNDTVSFPLFFNGNSRRDPAA